MSSTLRSQPGKPRGFVGQILGQIMAWYDRLDEAWTVEQIKIADAQKVLEIGFGPGQALGLFAAANPLATLTGIDHSETMSRTALRRNRAAVAAGRVRVLCGTVESLPFADRSFDQAFSVNSVYFWPSPVDAFRELLRVLKPSGYLAVTVRDRQRSSYAPFGAENLTALLTAAGFSSVEVRHNGVRWHPLICVIAVK